MVRCDGEFTEDNDYICGFGHGENACSSHHCDFCEIGVCTPDCDDEYCARTKKPSSDEMNECMLCAYPMQEGEEWNQDENDWFKDGKRIQWNAWNEFSYPEDSDSETFEAREKKIGSIRIAQNRNFPSGTSLQAYIKTNRAELRKVFGNPNMGESADGKSKGKEWNLWVGGKRVTIYDKREKDKKGTKYFNIGGKSKFGALLVAQALSIHRNERVYAKETVPKWLEDKGHYQQVKSIDEHPDLTYERAMEYHNNKGRYGAETFEAEYDPQFTGDWEKNYFERGHGEGLFPKLMKKGDYGVLESIWDNDWRDDYNDGDFFEINCVWNDDYSKATMQSSLKPLPKDNLCATLYFQDFGSGLNTWGTFNEAFHDIPGIKEMWADLMGKDVKDYDYDDYDWNTDYELHQYEFDLVNDFEEKYEKFSRAFYKMDASFKDAMAKVGFQGALMTYPFMQSINYFDWDFDIFEPVICTDHKWSNAYVRDTEYDDGTGAVTFGQDCTICGVQRRGSAYSEVSWDMNAESFGAEGNTQWDKILAMVRQYDMKEMDGPMFSYNPVGPRKNELPPFFNKDLVDTHPDFNGDYFNENVILFIPYCGDDEKYIAELHVSPRISKQKVIKQLQDWGIDTTNHKTWKNFGYFDDWGDGKGYTIYNFPIPNTSLCQWSNAYVRDTEYDDDGTAYTTFGQDCIKCNNQRRGSISGDVSWDKNAETFDVEFNEWADQELMSHGKNISFKDWAEDEGMKHGNTEITEWAQHEDESHDARYGAEEYAEKYEDEDDLWVAYWDWIDEPVILTKKDMNLLPMEQKLRVALLNLDFGEVHMETDMGGTAIFVKVKGDKYARRGLDAEELKRDSCCCGATKSNPCACMIQGIMECNATCPCSLEKKGAETFEDSWEKGVIRLAIDSGCFSDEYAEWVYRQIDGANSTLNNPRFKEIIDKRWGLNAENWGGDPKGKLALALQKARDKSKEPKKSLKIEKLDAENYRYVKPVPISHSGGGHKWNGYYAIKGYEEPTADGFTYRILSSPGTKDWYRVYVYDTEKMFKNKSRRLNPSGKMVGSSNPASHLIGSFPRLDDAKRALVFRMIQDEQYYHILSDGNLNWLLYGKNPGSRKWKAEKGIDTFTKPFEESSLDSGTVKSIVVGLGIGALALIGYNKWK